MNSLVALLNSDFCANLLTALLHSLWQAVAIAGLLPLFLRSRAAKDPNVRYAAGLAALGAVVLCGLLTWAVLDYEPTEPEQALAEQPSSETIFTADAQTQGFSESKLATAETIEPAPSSNRPAGPDWRTAAFCAWLLGVIVMLLRAVFVAVGGNRLAGRSSALQDERILDLVEQLRGSIGIRRRICVAVSGRICVPGVVGCFWPTLLLPVSMVSGVPLDDLRAILAHELAHIRRYDYIVNFCQMLVEAILFFNPAVWWISRQIRFEREACCDEAGLAAVGQRIRYAEVLADWARRLNEAAPKKSVPIVAFGKTGGSGYMLERIRRIVVAGHRPRLKVSWYVAAATLVLSFAVLLGLWRGTTMTVALAGKLLTPQQRIDTIRQIQRDHLTFEEREYTQEDGITISASVKTIDGKPLSRRTYARILTKGPEHSRTEGIQISRGAAAPFLGEGSLSVKVEYGVLWLYIKSEGYAPAFAGPLITKPGGELKNLIFILDKGFRGKLRIVNEDNEPVGGAKLVGDYIVRPEVSYNDIDLTTDENGLAIVENAAERPARFTVTAEGYELEKFEDIRLNSECPVVLKLTRAKETTGTVFSKDTGQPAPGAAIKVLVVNNASGGYSYDPDGGSVLAITDDQGRFALRTLRSDSRYLLTAEAAGLGHKLLYDVTAGREDMKVYLPGELRIKGRTTGPLEKLNERDGRYVIDYSLGINFDHNSNWTSSKKAIVEVRNGEGHFEIAHLKGNRVSIGSGSYRKVLDIENEPAEEVLIDLSDPVAATGLEYKSRELNVEFDFPEGSPAPQGKLVLKYIDPQFASNTYKNRELTIQNGQGRLDIPTPGTVGYDNSGIPGYWFAEKSGIKVPYTQEPFVITIQAVPAGTIYGEVFEHDGSKAKSVLVSVVAVEKSPLMGDSPFLNVEGKNSASDGDLDACYVISPLPLKGKYVVVVHKQDLYMVSDPIELDEAGPIRRLDITLDKGITFEARIVDEDGKPKPSVPVRLDYDTPWSHGFGSQPKYTNAEGTLVATRLNPNVPGTYRVIVKDVPGYRPVSMKVEKFDQHLEIKLERGKVVTGTVVDDETGWPIPGAEVYALPTDFSIPEPTTYLDADSKTDAQGRFRFSTMAKREYRLHVRSGQLADARSDTVVTGGQQEQVTLRVKLSERSDLKPRKPKD